MKILLANPRGFCAGVDRAVNIVYRLIRIYKSPIYVRHEIVHNRYVVENFRQMGVVFIDEICDVPDGSILVFSAHGVARSLRIEAKRRNLIVFDATCPLVSKVHLEVIHASRSGREVILIGHAGHPEVVGTLGQYTNVSGGIYLVESEKDVYSLSVKNANNLSFVTQTTLSVYDTSNIIDSLRERFPYIRGPKKDDICYATVNRQEAVYNLAIQVELVIIVGSKNSSNSNRLVEVVKNLGKLVYLVDSVSDIQEDWISSTLRIIGISSGASAPSILVYQIISRLKLLTNHDCVEVEELSGRVEDVIFNMPRGLI